MKKYKCREKSCWELLSQSGYCPKHQHLADVRKPFEGSVRSNTELYNTQRWKVLRKKVIDRDGGICTECGNDSRLTVDHVIPARGQEDLFWDEENLATLCFWCQRKKTQEEINSRRWPGPSF